MKNNIIPIACICITILEGIALLKGIDGALFSLSLSLIAGLCGYNAGIGLIRGKK